MEQDDDTQPLSCVTKQTLTNTGSTILNLSGADNNNGADDGAENSDAITKIAKRNHQIYEDSEATASLQSDT